MQRIFLMAAFLLSLFNFTTQAQVRVNVGVNIGAQPEWGPAGYDRADYYYMPDMDMYYDVPQRQFIYFDNGRWMFAASLPVRYRSYDLYHCYKVVINEPRPYLRGDMYRARYAGYRGRRDQDVWRDRREWHDNGNHYGWRNKEWHGRGNGHGHGRWRD